MHLLITLLSLLIVTSIARASLTPTPSVRQLQPLNFCGLWKIDRQQATAGGDETTCEMSPQKGTVTFTRKHLRIEGRVFNYQVLRTMENIAEIQFWLESGQLAEGVVFIANGTLSFQYLAGDEYHYYLMHRASQPADRHTNLVLDGKKLDGTIAQAP